MCRYIDGEGGCLMFNSQTRCLQVHRWRGRVLEVQLSNSQSRCVQVHRWRGCLMFVQSLAVMRQQKVIESGIKVPLCHLSPLLCQYNIFYSLSQLWSVHHSVTQFRALCHHRLARLIASVARIKVSLWSPTHAPNTTLDSGAQRGG